MIFERILSISVCLILTFFLVYRYIKRYNPENIVIISITSFFNSAYIFLVINSTYIPVSMQIIFLITIFIIPLIFVLLQYNNIILRRQLLYYRMRWNIHIKYYEIAKNLLYKLISETGRKAEYYYFLGLCYKYENDYVNARDSFSLAIELDKRDYLSYYELGKILDSTNKREVAVIMYNNALRIKPNYYNALESLGISLMSQGKYNEAVIAYKNALEYHPKSCELYYNIAMMELELGNLAEAEENFINAANLRNKLYSAYYNIGEINYFKGEYEKAVKFFKLARSSTIYGAKAYYKLAIIFAVDKEYEKAMSCLEYAIQIDNRYLYESKLEIAFENIKNKIEEYEHDLKVLEGKKLYAYEDTFKKRATLDIRIQKDIEQENMEKITVN